MLHLVQTYRKLKTLATTFEAAQNVRKSTQVAGQTGTSQLRQFDITGIDLSSRLIRALQFYNITHLKLYVQAMRGVHPWFSVCLSINLQVHSEVPECWNRQRGKQTIQNRKKLNSYPKQLRSSSNLCLWRTLPTL